MNNEIILKYGKSKKVADAVGCSREHVRMCLKGVVESDLSDKVRATALKLGGVEVERKK